MKSVASLIAVNPRGEVLLMQRDDRPGLTFPGHWNLIGGGVEVGESVEQALEREAFEEIGVAMADYQPYKLYYWRDYEVSVFYSRLDASIDQLIRGEGQDLRFFTSDAARRLTMVPITVDILADFFDSADYQKLT